MLLELRGRIFRHAQVLGLDFHERYTSGRIIARATSDVESIRELLTEGLQELLNVGLSVLYIACVLLALDWRLGLFSLATGVPLVYTVRRFRRRSKAVYTRRSAAIAAVIVRFSETMNGIRPVQAFRREEANDEEFGELNRRHRKANGDAILEMGRFTVSSWLIANTSLALVVLWGAYRVADGSLELGVLAAFVLYLRRLYDADRPAGDVPELLAVGGRVAGEDRRSAGPAALGARAARAAGVARAGPRPPRARRAVRRGALRVPHRR